LISNFRDGINKLIIPNGFFDQVMTIGRAGALGLIGKKWASSNHLFCSVIDQFIYRYQKWRVDEEGNMEKDLKNRGVLDSKILPYYPYRDDGVPLYNLIRKEYVAKVVNVFYGKSGNVEKFFSLC